MRDAGAANDAGDRIDQSAEVVSRIAAAREAARQAVARSHSRSGGISATSNHEGVEAYIALLTDKSLSTSERRLVAESAEANLALLSTGRRVVEQALAKCYATTTDYDKAAHYANLVLTTAGGIFLDDKREMISIQFAGLCKAGRFRDARALIETARAEEPPMNEYNRYAHDRWTKYLETLDKVTGDGTGPGHDEPAPPIQ